MECSWLFVSIEVSIFWCPAGTVPLISRVLYLVKIWCISVETSEIFHLLTWITRNNDLLLWLSSLISLTHFFLTKAFIFCYLTVDLWKKKFNFIQIFCKMSTLQQSRLTHKCSNEWQKNNFTAFSNVHVTLFILRYFSPWNDSWLLSQFDILLEVTWVTHLFFSCCL